VFPLLFVLYLLSFLFLVLFLAGNIRSALRQQAIDQHTANGKKKQDAANLLSIHVRNLSTQVLSTGPPFAPAMLVNENGDSV
jgi:hypothetical protein